MEQMEMEYLTNQLPAYVKQLPLFTADMLFYTGKEREKNKIQIGLDFERFIGLSVNKIRKYVIPERVSEYDKKHHFGTGKAGKTKKKDDIARVMYGASRLSDEFMIANRVIVKVHVIYEGYPNDGEHISLPPFSMDDVKHTIWEESGLCDIVTNYEFLFLVFRNYKDRERERKDRNTVLTDIFYVRVEDNDIVEVRRVYELTQKIIWEGVKQWPVRNKDGSVRMCPVNKRKPVMANNLPKAGESYICHVRPHSDPSCSEILDNGESINKQSFWFNKEYIRDRIDKGRVHPLFEEYKQ